MFKVDWNFPFDAERQEAIWFHGDKRVGEATLERDGNVYRLEIECNGETLFRVPIEDESGWWDWETTAVRYAEDWEAIGVHTDADLQAVSEKWAERGVEVWVHNSWFDLYTELDGEFVHLDAVTHTLTEAEQQAEALLTEVAAAGGWQQYLNAG